MITDRYDCLVKISKKYIKLIDRKYIKLNEDVSCCSNKFGSYLSTPLQSCISGSQ